VRGGILTMSTPAEAKTASKASVNVESRSWMRKRSEATRSLAQVYQEVTGGLGGPGCGGVGGHPEEMDPAGAHFHDEQDVESAQPDGVEGEEVGGQQTGGLSPQGGPSPGVCWTWWRPEAGGGQDRADGVGAHAVPESGEFSLEASVAPGGIFLGQVQHQSPDLVINRWAA
jgi:hypothetical protein